MKTKSFTLIELLVVIVIIGILAGVIIVSTSSSIDKANFAKAQAFSNTVQNELLSNLVSEWTFDNPDNIGEDTWGNNDGTPSGSPAIKTKEECVYGTCLYFNGSTDYIKTGETTTLLLPQFTTSVWVKLNTTQNYRGIVEMLGDGGGVARLMIFPGNTVRFHPFYNSNNTNSFVETTLLINEWINLTGTFDGTTGKLYKNGNYIGSTTLTVPLSYTSTTRLIIGQGNDSLERIFNGCIDDVRIYSAALSTSQIKQEYIAGLNSFLANNSISKEEYNERINSLALHDD